VEPSYLLERDKAPLDAGLLEALRDEAVRETTREISRLPERERRLVLSIVRQIDGAESTGTHLDSGESVDWGAAR
jgi:hypothetical protein